MRVSVLFQEADDNAGTYLLTPMLRTLPLSTSSSSFFHVGYGFAVSSSSTTLLEPFLNAIGLTKTISRIDGVPETDTYQ